MHAYMCVNESILFMKGTFTVLLPLLYGSSWKRNFKDCYEALTMSIKEISPNFHICIIDADHSLHEKFSQYIMNDTRSIKFLTSEIGDSMSKNWLQTRFNPNQSYIVATGVSEINHSHNVPLSFPWKIMTNNKLSQLSSQRITYLRISKDDPTLLSTSYESNYMIITMLKQLISDNDVYSTIYDTYKKILQYIYCIINADDHYRTCSWNTRLFHYLKFPESNPDVVVHDSNIVIVYDAYPKSKYHYLMFSRNLKDDKNKFLNALDQLNRNDLPQLYIMRDFSREFTKKNHQNVNFFIGFHAIPSMKPLHMHIISDDLVSTSLKTRYHWNSFTTSFFITIERVIMDIETNGHFKIDHQEQKRILDSKTLHCHRCSFNASSIARIKDHLKCH